MPKICSPTQLSPEWVDTHAPETYPRIRAEADCPCGIPERHRHCSHCGKLVTRGDWGDPGILIAVMGGCRRVGQGD